MYSPDQFYSLSAKTLAFQAADCFVCLVYFSCTVTFNTPFFMKGGVYIVKWPAEQALRFAKPFPLFITSKGGKQMMRLSESINACILHRYTHGGYCTM